MERQEIIKLVETHAGNFCLDAKFVSAIISVESSFNQWAARFEPDFFKRYLEGKSISRFGSISLETERVMRATSFGLMQAMGQVAREHGFQGTFLTELCNPDTGIMYGCKYLAWLKSKLSSDAHVDFNILAAAYNGGLGAVKGGKISNPEYPERVYAVMKAL